MVKPSAGLFLISATLFAATMLVSFWAVGVAASGSHELSYYFPAVTTSTASFCNGGSIESCLMSEQEEEGDDDDQEELEMDSETNRRILYWRRRYISYGALTRDRVPCSRRGYSYYNCRPGRPVNPYNRGCNAITRCRR
ncbi:unnamed protein product [Coffea canephora]|uniref:Uncharacterized protein n=1 Tax=Coffea canephora TaxID=49390 RepID=A0A068TRK7_COFCA|nr:unnamed protein product [Coffea canephora]